jgi:hypothetical protein
VMSTVCAVASTIYNWVFQCAVRLSVSSAFGQHLADAVRGAELCLSLLGRRGPALMIRRSAATSCWMSVGLRSGQSAEPEDASPDRRAGRSFRFDGRDGGFLAIGDVVSWAELGQIPQWPGMSRAMESEQLMYLPDATVAQRIPTPGRVDVLRSGSRCSTGLRCQELSPRVLDDEAGPSIAAGRLPDCINSLPQFFERNCNRLTTLAIVVRRDRIHVFLGKFGHFGRWFCFSENPCVAGSIPALSIWATRSACNHRSERILRALRKGLQSLFERSLPHSPSAAMRMVCERIGIVRPW